MERVVLNALAIVLRKKKIHLGRLDLGCMCRSVAELQGESQESNWQRKCA